MERKKLSDGKGIIDSGRLTDKAINILQNYYGMAMRSNVGDLYGMKKSVWGTDIARRRRKTSVLP